MLLLVHNNNSIVVYFAIVAYNSIKNGSPINSQNDFQFYTVTCRDINHGIRDVEGVINQVVAVSVVCNTI